MFVSNAGFNMQGLDMETQRESFIVCEMERFSVAPG